MSRFYVPWLVLYYVWVFLILGPRIKSRSYETLYDRVVSQVPWDSAWAVALKPLAYGQGVHLGSLVLPSSPSPLSLSAAPLM